jgi:long-chain acyl-CoA synthetase
MSALAKPMEPPWVAPSAMSNMIEPLLQSARRAPQRLALVTDDDELTYSELVDRISHMARVLHDRGIRPADRVAYLFPNSWEEAVLYFALQALGAVAVPLNCRSVAEEIPVFCESADVVAIVFADSAKAVMSEARREISPHVALWQCHDLIEEARRGADKGHWWAQRFHAEAPSRIQFTGGSTGRPKAAVRTHHADLVEIEGTYRSNGLMDDRDKVVLIQCPIDHHGGHDWLCMSLAVGATVVLERGFSAVRILKDIESYGVSYMILLPPTTYARLLDAPEAGQFDLSSVKVAQSSAGGLTRDIVSSIFSHFPNAHICFGWGQTESGLGSSFALTPRMLEDNDPHVFSVGTPMPFIKMRVVDESGNEVPDGIPGECIVQSEAVMSGYYGRPDFTKTAFTDDGWLRTGDIMSRDAQGFYYLHSRKKEMIKSGGENVFAGEVEGVIRSHPAVRDCIVFGMADARFGEAVACAVELKPGCTLTLAELQDYCTRFIASFKKPRHMTVLNSLNRDFSGKVNRAAIIEQCRGNVALPSSFVGEEREYQLERVSEQPEVWRISVPLVNSVERATSSYLIRGDATHGDLAVDLGENSAVALQALHQAWNALGVNETRLRVFITHEHDDHWGALASFSSLAGVFASEACAQAIAATEPLGRRRMHGRLRQEGFGDDDPVCAVIDRPRQAYSMPVTRLHQGDLIEVGSELFEVWITGGHTAGQAALFHRASGMLFSGDEVLADVTPPLLYDGAAASLGHYLAMVGGLVPRGVRRIMPGHGGVIAQPADRIGQLAEHHRLRLREIEGIVAATPCPGAHITAQINWNIDRPWTELSADMRWLTASETFEYLDYLTERGTVARTVGEDATFTYSKKLEG